VSVQLSLLTEVPYKVQPIPAKVRLLGTASIAKCRAILVEKSEIRG